MCDNYRISWISRISHMFLTMREMRERPNIDIAFFLAFLAKNKKFSQKTRNARKVRNARNVRIFSYFGCEKCEKCKKCEKFIVFLTFLTFLAFLALREYNARNSCMQKCEKFLHAKLHFLHFSLFSILAKIINRTCLIITLPKKWNFYYAIQRDLTFSVCMLFVWMLVSHLTIILLGSLYKVRHVMGALVMT